MPAGLERIAEVILGALAVATIVAIWAVRTRPAVLSRFAPLIGRLAGKSDAPAEAMREVESRIYAVPQWPIGRIAHVLQRSADLDHVTRAALATQLAESIAEIAPDFDRDRFIEAAQPDADG